MMPDAGAARMSFGTSSPGPQLEMLTGKRHRAPTVFKYNTSRKLQSSGNRFVPFESSTRRGFNAVKHS